MFNLEKLVRKNILSLTPYSSARSEFKGKGNIFLDANENPFGSPGEHPYNRYPDPLQHVGVDRTGRKRLGRARSKRDRRKGSCLETRRELFPVANIRAVFLIKSYRMHPAN